MYSENEVIQTINFMWNNYHKTFVKLTQQLFYKLLIN